MIKHDIRHVSNTKGEAFPLEILDIMCREKESTNGLIAHIKIRLSFDSTAKTM